MLYTITNFTNEYYEIKTSVPSYRFGQHFINKFIKDSSSEEMQELWNEEDVDNAAELVYDLIDQYKWDYSDLPLLVEER